MLNTTLAVGDRVLVTTDLLIFTGTVRVIGEVQSDRTGSIDTHCLIETDAGHKVEAAIDQCSRWDDSITTSSASDIYRDMAGIPDGFVI